MALLSTAPLPRHGQDPTRVMPPPTISSSSPWPTSSLPPPSSSSRRPKQQQTNALPPLLRPQKYKSLVYWPDTVTLTWPVGVPQQDNDDDDDQKVVNPPQRNNKQFQLDCFHFAIAKPGTSSTATGGGHVILGRNGSGKSLLVQHLVHPEWLLSQQQQLSSLPDLQMVPSNRVAHVSFASHVRLLQDHPHLTVHDCITGTASGNLTKAAQYLVVRFGLFPLLHRTVATLSTGEIRKCLLVAALAQQPDLLVLENALDGLDVTARHELRTMIAKTMQGLPKSGKMLVQHVNADNVPPTQVVVSTHRPEDIVPDVTTISMMVPTNDTSKQKLVTLARPVGWSPEQIMFMALGLDKNTHKSRQTFAVLQPWQQDDDTLPTISDIQHIWTSQRTPTRRPTR